MGICEILTIVFIVLKITSFINWSWFWVVFPEMIAVVFYLIVITAQVILSRRSQKIITEARDSMKYWR